MAESGVRGMLAWLRSVGHAPADAHEALALAVHGLLVQHGFRPHDQQPQPDASSAADLQQQQQQPRLPAQWGAAGYGGRYRHHRSALTFDVRAVAVGPRLVVHATIVEQDEALHSLDLRVDTYVRQGVHFAALGAHHRGDQPGDHRADQPGGHRGDQPGGHRGDQPVGHRGGDRGDHRGCQPGDQPGGDRGDHSNGDHANPNSDAADNWDRVFDNALDLATLVQVNIAHRLVPDAAKDGYQAAAQAGTVPSSSSAPPAGGTSANPNSAIIPPPYRPPYGPDDDEDHHHGGDPLRIAPPRRPGYLDPYGIPGLYPGGRDPDLVHPSPFGLGHDDLLAPGLPRPLGGGGLGGFGGAGGGNLMGPRHPAFGGHRGGLGGGPRVPGARFDPFGPPDPYAEYGPGGGTGIPAPGRNVGQPMGPGPDRPRPRGPDQGEPDNDIERPAPPDNDHGVPDGPPPDMYW